MRRKSPLVSPELSMDYLHGHFQESALKAASPAWILASIIKKKLAAKGVKCSRKRSLEIGEHLAAQLKSSPDGRPTFTLADGVTDRHIGATA